MSEYLSYIINDRARDHSIEKTSTDFVSIDVAKKIRSIYSGMSEYRRTPLVSLEKLGVGKIWVKDESYRFGLNSFKSLGGIYAIYKPLEKNGRQEYFHVRNIFSLF
jgi:diaminopropionate ammonia-lyase